MMRAIPIILLAVLAGVGGWYLGGRFGFPGSVDTSTDGINESNELSPGDAPAGKPRTIRCQGKFEPAAGLIRIVAPIGERIAKLTEKKIGQVVNKDELLITLQSKVLREKDLALAIARRADANAKAEFEKGQGKFQLDSAKLALEEANASDEKIASEAKKIVLLQQQLATAEQLLTRLINIESKPATTDLVNQTDLDKQTLMVDQLRLQIEQANLETEMARKSASRAKEVARNNFLTVENSLENSDKSVPLRSLDAAVAMAQEAVDMAEIRSPINNATILDIIVQESDTVTNQPVMVIGDTSKMICVAEVNDLFLNLIVPEKHANLRARITSSALKEPLLGTVVSKGIMIGPPSLKDPNPFAGVDRRTGTVTIELDNAAVAAKYVNLQVEVEIEVEPGAFGK